MIDIEENTVFTDGLGTRWIVVRKFTNYCTCSNLDDDFRYPYSFEAPYSFNIQEIKNYVTKRGKPNIGLNTELSIYQFNV